MKIHELTLSKMRPKKRVGRGLGSGHGKTAGRGTKGQNARSGGNLRLGFEGGQTQLAQRLPKAKGFTATAKRSYQLVSVEQLANLKAARIDTATLAKAGLIDSTNRPVKLLADGEIKAKITVTVQAASQNARKKIEAAHGSVVITSLSPNKQKTAPKTKSKTA